MTLYLSDSEARSFAQGERVLWRIIPDEAQPHGDEPQDYELAYINIICPFFKDDNHVELRETWWFAEMIEKYIFKADARDDGNVFHHGMLLRPDRWHSPVGLPSDGVRWHMIVKSVEVEQRDEKWWWKITMEERNG